MFTFWARLVLAIILALLGYSVVQLFEPSFPYLTLQYKIAAAIVGFVIGFLSFSQLATWIVQTISLLSRQFTLRLTSEIINQFTHLTSSGINFFPGQSKERTTGGVSSPMILDTSAIIDGRILDIAKTGFLYGLVMVPNFVLTELQQVADSADNLKRARGRKGFETIEQLKKIPGINVQVWDKEVAGKQVDDKLLRLGKILKGRVITCDFNLNRVASVSGVTVLNVNELSNALKTVAIPGESLKIKVIHEGKDKDQGVGYLADGTMVVIQNGAEQIGQEISIEVTRMLQIPAGRMIFGKIAA